MSEPSFRELMGEERAVGFDQVGITVASPESIRSWSNGEVKNPETIKTFELKNTLLFDGVPEQKNISKIMLENREAKTLTFDNQNEDVKKLIQY